MCILKREIYDEKGKIGKWKKIKRKYRNKMFLIWNIVIIIMIMTKKRNLKHSFFVHIRKKERKIFFLKQFIRRFSVFFLLYFYFCHDKKGLLKQAFLFLMENYCSNGNLCYGSSSSSVLLAHTSTQNTRVYAIQFFLLLSSVFKKKWNECERNIEIIFLVKSHTLKNGIKVCKYACILRKEKNK